MCSVCAKGCVVRDFRCFVVWAKFGFLYGKDVDVVLSGNEFYFAVFVSDAVDVYLKDVKWLVFGSGRCLCSRLVGWLW